MEQIEHVRQLQLALFRCTGEALCRLCALQQIGIKPNNSYNRSQTISEIGGYCSGLVDDYGKDGHQIPPLKRIASTYRDGKHALTPSAIGLISFLVVRGMLGDPNVMRSIAVKAVAEGMGIPEKTVSTRINTCLQLNVGILGLIGSRPEPHIYLLDKFRHRFFEDVDMSSFGMNPLDYEMQHSIGRFQMRIMAQASRNTQGAYDCANMYIPKLK